MELRVLHFYVEHRLSDDAQLSNIEHACESAHYNVWHPLIVYYETDLSFRRQHYQAFLFLGKHLLSIVHITAQQTSFHGVITVSSCDDNFAILIC